MLEMFKKFDQVERIEKETENDFYTYDGKEDIEKCLNCKKAECNNCLKHKNFI